MVEEVAHDDTRVSHTPADDYEAFLDATVGLEPALIEAEPRQAPADRFVVDDDHTADWALRKLGQLDAQKRQRAAFVAAEMERLQAWQAHEDRQAERFAAYLTALLRPYYDQLKAEGKVSARHKSYRLPHGALTARQAPIEWEVDEATLLAWAEATPSRDAGAGQQSASLERHQAAAHAGA